MAGALWLVPVRRSGLFLGDHAFGKLRMDGVVIIMADDRCENLLRQIASKAWAELILKGSGGEPGDPLGLFNRSDYQHKRPKPGHAVATVARIGLLLAMMVTLTGFKPVDKRDIAFVLRLPAPASELAAQQTAEAFIRQQLDYPPNTELTFKPAMRAFIAKNDPQDPAYVAIWMCGTVRVGSTANTADWLVAFDWKRPDLIRDGGTTFLRVGRLVPANCREIYRDGILVFHP